MELDYYENLPEGMDKRQLNNLYKLFFAETLVDELSEVVKKLEILFDKQWHSYELPDKEVQDFISKWVVENWSDDQSHIELVLNVCYSYGLEKSLYERALEIYRGSNIEEYERDLLESEGLRIDPYWSMKK